MSGTTSSIVFVGGPACGKTVLLAVLALRYNLRPMDAEAQNFRNDAQVSLDSQVWPDATPAESRRMHWRLKYKDKNYPLWTRDVPGEKWKHYVIENQIPEELELAEEFKGLEEQIKSAPGLCLLLDLKSDIDEGRNFEQKNFVEATANLLEKNQCSTPVVLVVTKSETYGRNRDELTALVEQNYQSLFDGPTRPDILFIDAVADTVADPDNPALQIPAEDFHSEGIEALLDWIAQKTDNRIIEIDSRTARNRFFRGVVYAVLLWWLAGIPSLLFVLDVFAIIGIEYLIRKGLLNQFLFILAGFVLVPGAYFTVFSSEYSDIAPSSNSGLQKWTEEKASLLRNQRPFLRKPVVEILMPDYFRQKTIKQIQTAGPILGATKVYITKIDLNNIPAMDALSRKRDLRVFLRKSSGRKLIIEKDRCEDFYGGPVDEGIGSDDYLDFEDADGVGNIISYEHIASIPLSDCFRKAIDSRTSGDYVTTVAGMTCKISYECR